MKNKGFHKHWRLRGWNCLRSIILLFIFQSSLAVLLLSCNAESALKKGDQYYALGEYFDAAAEYKKAYGKTPMKLRDKRGERAMKMADCYQRINYTAKAIGSYQNAIRYTEKAMSDRKKAQEAKEKEEAAKREVKASERTAKMSRSEAKRELETTEKEAKTSKTGKAAKQLTDNTEESAKTSKADSAKEKAREKAERAREKALEKAEKENAKALEKAEKIEAKAEKAKAKARKKAESGKKSRSKRRGRGIDDDLATDTSLDPQDSLAEVSILNATLQLARLQHKNGDYKNAIKNYEQYIEDARVLYPLYPTVCTPQNDTIAMNGLIGARRAPNTKKRGSLYTVKKEPLLNSRRSDFSPALLGDDSEMLYWTTTRPQSTGDDLSGITGTKYADIFWTKKDDKGKWATPEKVEGELNSELEEGVCCFTPDGKTMYLTRCITDPDYPRYAKIYTSQRSDASWSKPQEVKISKDTLSSFAHPAVSPDGHWLYFVSDMPGGHGGKDIWRISIEGKTIGGAECLPAPINTPGDEMFPTFRPNGDLYFSSDGHPGMGGLDLFMARQDSVTHTWALTHLPSPMNSQGDDFGMTFEGPHNRGYFATNRGDARGWDHLMSFECPEVTQTVRGWVYEKDGYELPAGLVYMIGNDGTNQKLSVRGDGSFEMVVQPHVEYLFLGTCKGYLNHVEELTVDTSSVSREYVLQFPLASITAPVLVRNVFYEFDSAALTDESTAALDSLTSLLNENPNVTIELSAHCDYRGNDQYNERLSQRRAESVVRYLIEHGIASDRLTPKGYGESRPKVVKRRIAEQYEFLHEGDTLTEAFIRALPNDSAQEACNALNRRTEFRVLRTTYGLFDQLKDKASTKDAKAATEADAQAQDQPGGKAEEGAAEATEGRSDEPVEDDTTEVADDPNKTASDDPVEDFDDDFIP